MQTTANDLNDRFGLKNKKRKDKGWYWRIAYDEYDPASLDDRKAFGLGPRPCPTCKRKITTPRIVHVRERRPPTAYQIWWKRLDKKNRERLIESLFKEQGAK
jgi:hypothetical protein